MKRMLHTIGLVLGVAGTVFSVLPGTAGASEGLSIAIGLKAQFLNGALVGIPVVYSCAEGSMFPSLSVSLFQASGKEVVNGFGFEDSLECDGEPKQIMVFVVPGSGAPFRRSKDVVVEVNVSACDELVSTCVDASDGPRVLSLKR